MIKLIAMDLDGTLFDDDHRTISKRNIDAIVKAHNKGIKIVIASGRTLCQINNILKLIPADYVIASNGAAAIDREGRVISSDGMDYESWTEAYKVLEEYNTATEVYAYGKTYLKSSQKGLYKNKYLNNILLNELKAVINYCDDVTQTLKNKIVEKITSIYIPEDVYNTVRERLLNMGLAVTSSVPYNIEVNKMGVNKGKGLSSLCRELNIKSDEAMAFGDGSNDVEMLLWAGCSYAMGNAVDEAKKAAKHIADTNHNNGLGKAIEAIL